MLRTAGGAEKSEGMQQHGVNFNQAVGMAIRQQIVINLIMGKTTEIIAVYHLCLCLLHPCSLSFG